MVLFTVQEMPCEIIVSNSKEELADLHKIQLSLMGFLHGCLSAKKKTPLKCLWPLTRMCAIGNVKVLSNGISNRVL